MALRGVHLLLTYQCIYECDHCFVWSSPSSEGTMTLAMLRDIMEQSGQIDSVRVVYFEGGEPFLFYPLMVEGMRMAAQMGLDTGIVTNAYWATCPEDADLWLRPLADLRLVDLSVSSDLFHADEPETSESRHVLEAAGRLEIPSGVISIPMPCPEVSPIEGGLRFRGRAAEKLVADLPREAWDSFDECPYEALEDPGRVHVDPFGYVHLCQGLVLGNLLERPLDAIMGAYEPAAHPVIGPLLQGGPAELARRYNLPHEPSYVDACHFCYEARKQLRERFPEALTPGQVYGEDTDRLANT